MVSIKSGLQYGSPLHLWTAQLSPHYLSFMMRCLLQKLETRTHNSFGHKYGRDMDSTRESTQLEDIKSLGCSTSQAGLAFIRVLS